MDCGGLTEYGKIESILLKHPKDAWHDQQTVKRQFDDLNYLGCPDYAKACTAYDSLVDYLKKFANEIHYLPSDKQSSLDSVYVRDPIVISPAGAIICRMGKELRRSETDSLADSLSALGIPIAGEISGDGMLEGGDLIWMGYGRLAVGRGYRTNSEGIRQLEALTKDYIDELVIVDLPHWQGSSDVLHLMSNISPIDKDLALVYSPLLTVTFRNWLLDNKIELVEVPESEYASMGCNVLAVAPRQCLMIEGNPITKARLEEAGATVFEYDGSEISLKGSGGPTCLTRPLRRED
ncbi:MAG: arginine deiminase family protein [candidate division Zixibacteria bacterium]